jgi:hypothetical protein
LKRKNQLWHWFLCTVKEKRKARIARLIKIRASCHRFFDFFVANTTAPKVTITIGTVDEISAVLLNSGTVGVGEDPVEVGDVEVLDMSVAAKQYKRLYRYLPKYFSRLTIPQ